MYHYISKGLIMVKCDFCGRIIKVHEKSIDDYYTINVDKKCIDDYIDRLIKRIEENVIIINGKIEYNNIRDVLYDMFSINIKSRCKKCNL
jgi:hypothetical protein